MVDILPFKATIINTELARDTLVCPVYDTIDSSAYQKYAKVKENIIHATTRRKDMGRDEFVLYASKELERFKASKILIEREKPAFYIYGIMYTLQPEILVLLPEKNRREKYFVFGLVCLVKVEELGKGSIVGHENTFEVNTQERYKLMKACMMNFSPITAEYSMPEHELNNLFEEYLGFKRPNYVPNPEKPPVVDVALCGSRHLLWEIADELLIEKIKRTVSAQKLLVLDGHHRYTASYLMKEKDGIEYTMIMLMEGGDRALLLLPWHRAIRNFKASGLGQKIQENFSVIWEGDKNGEEFYSQLRQRSSEYDVKLGFYDGKKFSILKADENAVREFSGKRKENVGLELIALHEWIINPLIEKPEEDVSFNASPAEAINRVKSGEFIAAFLLNPVSIKDVEKKAFIERKNFPQKSTLFLPKVAEGIVMRKIK